MQEFKIGHSKVNSLLINLNSNIYTRTWYQNVNRRYYLNFYDYLLSQLEFFTLGDTFPTRKLEDYKKATLYVESFVTGSPHRYVSENSQAFITAYSYFLSDISALLLLFTESNSFELIPTLPKELLKERAYLEALDFQKNENNTDIVIFQNSVFGDYRRNLISQLENPKELEYDITYILTELFSDYKKVLELSVDRIIDAVKDLEDPYGYSVIKAFVYKFISQSKRVAFVDERM